jgi:hypothetical protein
VLYDVLRPVLVHVVHLETLTELGVVAKAEFADVNENSTGRYRRFHASDDRS